MSEIERLIYFHEEEGVPYTFIAKRLGINGNTFSGIVNGKNKPKPDQLKLIDEYLRERGY